jgi:hypothetical protein
MRDDVILAQALSGYAKELRAQASRRGYSGEQWAEFRAEWRATANRAVELATQAASMAEVFEEPRPPRINFYDAT